MLRSVSKSIPGRQNHLRVVIDKLACEGYGKCERIAPDLFKMDDEGVAYVLIDDALNPERLERAKAAVKLCPVKAIFLVDMTSG